MKMRSSSSMASQFGLQEWLIQRASLPPISALITSPLSSPKLNVCGSLLSSGATSQETRWAGVFDNTSTFGNDLRSVNTATVHAGLANLDPCGSLSNFALLRHAQWGIKPEEGKIRKEELTIGRRNGW